MILELTILLVSTVFIDPVPIRIDTPCVIYARIEKPPPMNFGGTATVYTTADWLIDCGPYWLAVKETE